MIRARLLLAVACSFPALGLAACASNDGASMSAGNVIVRVEGAQATRPGDLLDAAGRELAAFGAGRHRTAAAADAAYVIAEHLNDAGYSRAQVTFELLPDEDAPQVLVLRVVEGPRTLLGDVTFPGANAFDPADLRALIRRQAAFPFGAAPVFRMLDVDDAIRALERLYRLRGHPRARVGPAEVRMSDDGTRADVVVPVAEGRRFTVSRVVLDRDLPRATRDAIQSVLRAHPERPIGPGAGYHDRLPAEVAAVVRGRLREEGHRTADVRAGVEIDDEAATAEIRVDVDAGPRHVLGDLTIVGTERTDPAFARERVELATGDVLRQSDLDAGIDGLYGTGAFRRVRISPPPEALDGPETLVSDLTFTVDEAAARSLEAGGGWGSYELLRGWVAYRDRNVGGMGRRFDADAHVSLKAVGIGVRVADKYLLGGPQTLSSGLRYEVREEPSFDSRALEFDTQVRHEVDPDHHVTYGYRMRIDEASDRDSRVLGVEDRRSRAAGLFAAIGHDTRDDRLFPTRGVVADGGVFWSADSLGADLEFLEWKASWARYWPLGSRTVLAIGAGFVTRDPLGAATSLPIQERLFLGGEGDVRSFLEGELGPTDAGGDPRGGLTAATASIELRRKLWAELDGALFYDWGTVGERALDLDARAGAAIGVGLRYRLPVGPIRLDFGYNPASRFGAARRWALHLSFGFSF